MPGGHDSGDGQSGKGQAGEPRKGGGRKGRERRDREQAERLGRRAEWLCRLALWIKGYRILGTRLRLPVGEIDILAERRDRFGPVLAVVEVKARRTAEQAHGAVGQGSWRRLAAAASRVQRSRRRLAGHAVRFDLMIVLPRRWPMHLEDYWRP